MGKYKAVLFDFDGTIMDTNQAVFNSWFHVYDVLGLPRPSKEALMPTFGMVLEDCLAEYFPDHPSSETLRIFREYQKLHFCETVHLFPGCSELFKELKARNIKLGVVTSREWSTLRNNCYDFKEESLFDAIVSSEDTNVHKPNPEPCFIALRKLGVNAGEALMVGDSCPDTLCAKNAMVDSVLVGWSLACPKEKATGIYEPTYIIDTPAELLDLI